jgi:hypothetical protein
MTASQARKLTELRTTHDLDICHFPVYSPVGKQYKFYIRVRETVPWNPVNRNAEGKITGYKLFNSFEEGIKEALSQAKILISTVAEPPRTLATPTP